jgi:hypothetical protein
MTCSQQYDAGPPAGSPQIRLVSEKNGAQAASDKHSSSGLHTTLRIPFSSEFALLVAGSCDDGAVGDACVSSGVDPGSPLVCPFTQLPSTESVVSIANKSRFIAVPP